MPRARAAGFPHGGGYTAVPSQIALKLAGGVSAKQGATVLCSIPSKEADLRRKEFNLCDLEVVLKSGQRKTVRVECHRGHWKNPMTDAEMEEKFRSQARKHLPPDRVHRLVRQLWALEDMPKAGALVEMTRV